MKSTKKTGSSTTSKTTTKTTKKTGGKKNRYEAAAADLVAQCGTTPDGGWEGMIPDLAAATGLNADRLYDAVLKTAAPVDVDPMANMPGYREHSNALAAKAEERAEFADASKNDNVTLAPKTETVAAQQSGAAVDTNPVVGLPIDPKAPASARLKICPLCRSVQIVSSWKFCYSCWDLRKATKKMAASGKPAAAAVSTPGVN